MGWLRSAPWPGDDLCVQFQLCLCGQWRRILDRMLAKTLNACMFCVKAMVLWLCLGWSSAVCCSRAMAGCGWAGTVLK